MRKIKFYNFQSKELFFGLAIIFSSIINYAYVALLNKSFEKAAEFYLGQSLSIVLTSLFSLGLVNSILKFTNNNNLLLTLYASLFSILFSSILLFYFISLKAAILPIAIIVDLFFFYFRSIGSYVNFFVAKIVYAIIPLVLFYYFNIDPHYLILFASITIIIFFANKLKLKKGFFIRLNPDRKQIEYAWPIGINTLLRTFISYLDQIFFLIVLREFDLDNYTKLIKLSMGFRLAFSLPHVRLLPLYLKYFSQDNKLYNLERFYRYFIVFVFLLLIFLSSILLNIFSIPQEFIYLTLILITAELIRASSSYKQLYYSYINRTIYNLYGNLFTFMLVAVLFYPSYLYFDLNGLVSVQFISSLSLIIYHSWKIRKLKSQFVS